MKPEMPNYPNIVFRFKELFPIYFAEVTKYSLPSKNTLKITTKTGNQFIFRYNGLNDWSFNTLKFNDKEKRK